MTVEQGMSYGNIVGTTLGEEEEEEDEASNK
jgi:hypothetical protein